MRRPPPWSGQPPQDDEPQGPLVVPIAVGMVVLGLIAWFVFRLLTAVSPLTGQMLPCDGQPPPAQREPLSEEVSVVRVVVCREAWDTGNSRMKTLELTDPEPLVGALLLDDTTPWLFSGGCSEIAHASVNFVLTLADGSTIRPGAPSDGCAALPEVYTALDGLSTPVTD